MQNQNEIRPQVHRALIAAAAHIDSWGTVEEEQKLYEALCALKDEFDPEDEAQYKAISSFLWDFSDWMWHALNNIK